MWGKFVYREITPPERLVFVNSFSDEAGGLPAIRWRRPGRSKCSRLLPSRKQPGGKTKFTVRWAPHNAD